MNPRGDQLTDELRTGAALEELMLHVHVNSHDMIRRIVVADLERAAEKRLACSTNGEHKP